MRLLNTKTLELSYFVDSQVPPYAILSHTWGQEEVLFDDIQKRTGGAKSGFKKLEGCCKKAAGDGFEWVWIDTCCIDKSSSAELTEAINSMYQWYKASVLCYVYLEDILTTKNAPLGQFAGSRWFTRGWTLQELIAPRILEFYTAGWVEIGTKASLSRQISEVTGVPTPILRGEDPSTCVVAHRMSWASKRQTTRVEDIAYCLLGIFGVSMPMLYGEGVKAFQRLQEEIMKQNEDYTLFAWSLHYDCSPALTGILASSPADFSDTVIISMQKPMLHHHSSELNQIRILEEPWRNFGEDNTQKITELVEAMAENPVPSLPYQIAYQKDYDGLVSVDQLNITQNHLTRNLPVRLFNMQYPPQQTSRGIRMRIPLKISEDPSMPSMAWIYCFLGNRPVCIFVDQPRPSANLFARRTSSWLVTISLDQLRDFALTDINMHPTGVLDSSGPESSLAEQVWGRIKLVHEDNEEGITAELVSVYPLQQWNLDEMFFTGQPDVIGAFLFDVLLRKECPTSLLSLDNTKALHGAESIHLTASRMASIARIIWRVWSSIHHRGRVMSICPIDLQL